MNTRSSGLFGDGENPVSLFVEKLDKAQADLDVKALIVRINSPGGGVTASDIMYQRLRRFKAARNVPVIAVLQDVAASGGYYIACGSDTIISHPTSVTGSIGVIVQTVSFAGTMQKLGISAKAFTSGPFKEMGSPLKPLEPGEGTILQGIVDDFYGRFLKVVQAGRPKLTEERIRELADGRVYTGDQALANGLVDQLGYMDDALAMAKQRSGAGRMMVVFYGRPLGYKPTAYAAAPSLPAQVNFVNVAVPDFLLPRGPQMMYLWTGQEISER
jgi:protease-4